MGCYGGAAASYVAASKCIARGSGFDGQISVWWGLTAVAMILCGATVAVDMEEATVADRGARQLLFKWFGQWCICVVAKEMLTIKGRFIRASAVALMQKY